jgi:hypothetical protein
MAFAGVVTGCVPATPSAESLESSIVLTKRAPTADFKAFKTFFLRPEIRQLTSEGQDTVLDDTYAAPLLAETQKQLTSRGYVSVDVKSDADLAVEMLYVTSEWVATSCYSWWDPYYWGYPGWGYYPYYGGCSASTWKSSTLATLLTDLTPARSSTAQNGAAAYGNADDSGAADAGRDAGGAADAEPDGEPRVVGGIWFSGIYGIVFSASDSLQRGLDGIKQAFVQSPYVTKL